MSPTVIVSGRFVYKDLLLETGLRQTTTIPNGEAGAGHIVAGLYGAMGHRQFGHFIEQWKAHIAVIEQHVRRRFAALVRHAVVQVQRVLPEYRSPRTLQAQGWAEHARFPYRAGNLECAPVIFPVLTTASAGA
jgi:hypothetical protein